MGRVFPRKSLTSSKGRKRSSPLPTRPPLREEKSAQYKDASYETLLRKHSSFMDTSEQDISEASSAQIWTLLEKEQDVPPKSLFQDSLSRSTFRRIRNKNEAWVIRDISPLIVPSAETLAEYGEEELGILIESTDERWKNSIPLVGARPQPDYSVGFREEAFSVEQHEKLAPFLGNFLAGDQSYFMANYYMYFPSFTCEVKCGAAGLDVADRQNAHSMTLAVRAVVELFRLVQREQELNQEILAFSISHNHRSVRIYGHYAIVDGRNTKFYRHPIRTFDFTELNGKEKWTAYKFTKSLYNTWLPAHFKRICSAIDDLPSGVNFDVEPLHASKSFTESANRSEDNGRQSGTGVIAPNTSSTKQGPSKKRKRQGAK
ncbi:hypothetical protein GQ44DRAFT_686329 [Phaeosphaeriaceae sp. PMI808]|nr:hypothetical protein GQ44DRAFT_686329 [Phaeosphaeriaceae sp. PMI808]